MYSCCFFLLGGGGGGGGGGLGLKKNFFMGFSEVFEGFFGRVEVFWGMWLWFLTLCRCQSITVSFCFLDDFYCHISCYKYIY